MLKLIRFSQCSLPLCLSMALGILPGAPAAQAQTATTDSVAITPEAQAVIDRYIEATGGRARYEAITSQKTVGSINIPQARISGDMTVYQKGGDKMLAEINIAAIGEQKRGMNGKVCWETSAIQGPRLITGDEADGMLREGDLQSVLHLDRYYKTITVSPTKVTVNGSPATELLLLTEAGDKEKRRYSDTSGLLLESDTPLPTPVGKIVVKAKYTDYRDVDGLKIPFATEQILPQGLTQEVKLKSVELNPELDDSMFALPESIKALQ